MMKKVVIITSDTLHSLGLQGILAAYFAPIEIEMLSTFKVDDAHEYDYYFLSPQVYAENLEHFHAHQHFMLISTGANGKKLLDVSKNQEDIIERITKFFTHHNSFDVKDENGKTLSDREIQVLKLVAMGRINKEIADKLSISFNTVLTHRKNITSKLGIKTVSGLTFYAIAHGYVSSSDVSV